MKVEITNFQSIAHAELEVEGLTVLVGKSNIGKSAVIRAVSGALGNLEGDTFVREGDDITHCEVHLEVPASQGRGALDLTWRKGGSYNDYDVNGEELRSVGRGAPEHVAKAGFFPLEVGRDQKLSVQVADQFDPLFLLDDQGSVAAEAISDVERLTTVQDALRSCDSDRRSAKATKKVRTKDLADVQAKKAVFETYEEDMRQYQEVRDRWSKALSLEREIVSVERLVENYNRHHQVVSRFDGVADIEVPSPEPLESYAEALGEVRQLEVLLQARERCARRVEALQGVADVEAPAGGDKLQEMLSEYAHAQSLFARARRSLQLVKAYQGVETLEVPELSVEPLQEDVARLSDFQQRLTRALSRMKSCQDAQVDLDERIEALDTELHDLLHEAGVCPTCERSMKAGAA